MSAAAKRLGTVLATRTRKAAEARWLTVGVVTGTDPLLVEVDGAEVTPGAFPAGSYTPAIGDPVLLGVLRGSPAVGYLMFGKIQAAT